MVSLEESKVTEPETTIASPASRQLLNDWIVPSLGLLVIIVLLWLPFGFKMTGLVEEWGVIDSVRHQPLFFITENTAFASHRIRPLEVLPHTVANLLTPDSFVGFNLLYFLFYLGKGIFAFALLRRLTSNNVLAFFTAILFLIYPADTGLFAFRVIHIHCAIFLLLLALYLLVVYWETPRWYTLLGMWTVLTGSLLMYEVGYPIILFAPLLLIFLSGRIDRHLIWVCCCWYLVPLITAIRTIIILKQPNAVFQTDVITKVPTDIIGPILAAYARSFVGGWVQTLMKFDTKYLLIAAMIALIAFTCGFWLSKKTSTNLLPVRKELWRYGVFFVIGLGIIPLGFALYILSPGHIIQTLRVYLIPSLGASLCIAVVIWVMLRPLPYRATIFGLIAAVLIGLASVNALSNHAYYNSLSLGEQRLLGQIVSQAPGLTKGNTVFIIDKAGYFANEYSFAMGDDLDPAINYLYDTSGINVQICPPHEMASAINEICNFQQQGISVNNIYATGSPVDTIYHYDKAVLFELTPQHNLVLLASLSKNDFADENIALSSYVVPSTITSAPLPRRATTLFTCWPVENCTAPIEQPAQKSVHIDFGTPIIGIGWRGAELFDVTGSYFRWSVSSHCELYTRLQADHSYSVRIRLVYAISPEVLKSLQVKFNDYPIALERVDSGSLFIVLQGRIPREAIPSDETLSTLHFYSDLQLVTGTNISLGLAFSDVLIEAAD